MKNNLLRIAFHHQESLTVLAFAVTRNWALAKDAVQEAFISFNEKIDTIEDESKVLPWLKTAVRFRAIDQIRKTKNEVYIPDEKILSIIESSFDPGKEVKSNFQEKNQNALKECMKGLKPDFFEIIHGFYTKGESCEVIAEKVGKSTNAVRILLSRIRQKLKKCVDKKMRAI